MTTCGRIILSALLASGVIFTPLRRCAADTGDSAERARVVLRRYCQACHAGPADQVKGDLRVLDREQVLKRKVVRPGDPVQSELLTLVDCGSMPPGDLAKPQTAEVQSLREWIAAGAPDFPPEYGEKYVVQKIQKDLLSVGPKELPYQRYVSFNHLLAEDPAADRTLWRDALLKALNHLSWKPEPVPVTPVDPAETIYRVDVRRLGWDLEPFESPAKTNSQVDLFDLVLLEYPYATLPARFGGDQKVLADYMRRANPIRPILYVRGDWLVSVATQPPLYEDLLRLPRTLSGPGGLEEKIGATGEAARAGFLEAGMSRFPELVERRADTAGAYWRTFDLGGVRDLKGLLHEAGADGERGGLMLFSLPNGLNGYYIAENVADENNKRLVRLAASAPRDWVADPLAPEQVARNGLSCMRCHVSGVQPFEHILRPAQHDLSPDEKARLLPLFPGKPTMDKFLADDAARFQAAVAAVHGRPLEREPLGPVTGRFFKSARTAIFPALLAEGAEPVATTVASGGDRPVRDMVRFPAAEMDAPPLPPLDGLTLPEFQPPLRPVDVTFRAFNFKTKQPANTFVPGDQLAIEATNQGARDIYIELIGVSGDGHMIVHQPPVKLEAGKTYHYPRDRPAKPKDFVEMALPPGVDRYVLFAADAEFPGGVRLRSVKDKDVADRVVHPFWEISADGSEAVVRFDPSHLVKKTLAVETREH